ncbi:hypothetical protein HPP92_001714 [Vanilla planifolia]|uniref:Uncharacterized protein n=1 Tax=Vanilla planifolia TaxID=51239 RepID=A0A835SCG2_VANPL|nr:hypothetical protein HPP92_001714 [Vanilla planifolia]
MEWKEGNINTARELYKRALSINSTSESAARCLQAWGVLEHRAGNLSTARMLFRSSLNINSQSYVTWTTWAAFEEEQGNAERAEEIRSLYFQQRTEVVDDASWVMGFLDIIDPAIDSVKRLLNLGRSSSDSLSSQEILRRHQMSKGGSAAEKADSGETAYFPGNINGDDGFDLDSFIKDKLSLDVSKLNDNLEMFDSMKSSTIKKRYAWIRRENSGLPAMG